MFSNTPDDETTEINLLVIKSVEDQAFSPQSSPMLCLARSRMACQLSCRWLIVLSHIIEHPVNHIAVMSKVKAVGRSAWRAPREETMIARSAMMIFIE